MGCVSAVANSPHGAPGAHHVLLTLRSTAVTAPETASVLGGRSPEDLRRTAVRIATAAAGHVRDTRRSIVGPDGRVPVAATKSSDVDPVTAVDRSSEDLIRSFLADHAPRDAILGEEDGGSLQPDAVTWIVDPIDGTVNFIYGIPASAVSIAATVNGAPVAGAVADIARDRVFSACTGGPARVRDAAGGRCRVLGPLVGPADLSKALVGTGFSYSSRRRERQAGLLTDLLPRIRDIRRLGSAALDLCAVASGVLDGYYEHGLGPWDHAAGALIAARAGAQVHMPVLTAGYDDGVGVVAAAPSVARELAGQIVAVRMPADG
ncbi:inositol monophosphatase family protein [uncultured Corynebacterium sp.]|uniref:inositol monophosphatase family protein n=1 Tax=uncultured Corynebacterium sp. TaxID=159447 RepID=UPI0025ED2299|nr:inositol monophosphatase family protein [uncultured Corynebacterium sp.]